MINRRLTNLVRAYRPLVKGTAFFSIYLVWLLLFRLLVLTLLTYFIISSGGADPTHAKAPRYEEINEALSASELWIVALGSLIFVLLIPLFNPLTSTTRRELFHSQRFEKKFIPGFLQGALFAGGVVLAFLISGIYRYLGFFIHFEDTSFALGNVLLRCTSLGLLVYCEEFIFRGKLLQYLETGLEKTIYNRRLLHLVLALCLSLFFCVTKALQFDLGLTHQATLFLVSFFLTLRALDAPLGERFESGAGFWAAVLILFHPLLSLPIFGNEFSGLILVKFQPPGGGEALLREATTSTSALFRFFTGGTAGPLSAFALQLLLIFEIARRVIKAKSL